MWMGSLRYFFALRLKRAVSERICYTGRAAKTPCDELCSTVGLCFSFIADGVAWRVRSWIRGLVVVGLNCDESHLHHPYEFIGSVMCESTYKQTKYEGVQSLYSDFRV